MPKSYQCEIEVRGHELDSFGHVNHAIYVSYLEHARWKLLEKESIRPADFVKWQRWPVIAEIQLKYLKPTFMGDRLVIKTELAEHGRTHFAFAQTISRDGQPVLEARIRAVMVNEKGRPAEVPDEIDRLWAENPENKE